MDIGSEIGGSVGVGQKVFLPVSGELGGEDKASQIHLRNNCSRKGGKRHEEERN
jgi:hypothetical protein